MCKHSAELGEAGSRDGRSFPLDSGMGASHEWRGQPCPGPVGPAAQSELHAWCNRISQGGLSSKGRAVITTHPECSCWLAHACTPEEAGCVSQQRGAHRGSRPAGQAAAVTVLAFIGCSRGNTGTGPHWSSTCLDCSGAYCLWESTAGSVDLPTCAVV